MRLVGLQTPTREKAEKSHIIKNQQSSQSDEIYDSAEIIKNSCLAFPFPKIDSKRAAVLSDV